MRSNSPRYYVIKLERSIVSGYRTYTMYIFIGHDGYADLEMNFLIKKLKFLLC